MANIKDVAKLAGVSVTTVSRVLNNKGYISQDTYESVYRAIDQLDYVPNQIARNLFKQKSYYISLIVPDSSHPFWAEITKYIERKLYKHHYKLFLCNTGDTEDKERDYIKMMRENMVDGIILGTHMLAETEYQNLDLPIVALDYRVAEDIPTIYSDHNKGGLLAAGEILKLVIDYVEHLRPDLVLERFVSQSPKELLIAPDWGLKNYEFVTRLQKRMKERGAYQGKKYRDSEKRVIFAEDNFTTE